MRQTAVAVLLLASAILAMPLAAADWFSTRPDGLRLDQGSKWPTDEALRRGMIAINDLVHKAPAAVHKGTARTEAYVDLGERIDREAKLIAAQSKLPPDASAMLRVLLSDVGKGAEVMKSAKLSAAGRGGLSQVINTLRNYDKYFDHPGWMPVAR